MKKFMTFLFLFLPITGFAQNYQGMNEADMQKMMQQMEKMKSCMEKVDEQELKAIEQRSKQIEEEVKALCASGKRDEAQQKAISLGEEIANSPTMQQVSKCDGMIDEMMAKMAFTAEDKPSETLHVCD